MTNILLASAMLLWPFALPIGITSLSTLDQLPHTSENSQFVYFVRHGESEYNAAHITQGRCKLPCLTAKGQNQADLLADQLAKRISPQAQLVVASSTAKRAQETANSIFAKLKEQKFDVVRLEDYDDLLELGQGDWEGQPKDSTYLAEVESWKKLSPIKRWETPKMASRVKDAKSPDGCEPESLKEVAARALRTLSLLFAGHKGKTIVIVSHGTLINATTLQLSGASDALTDNPTDELPTIQLGNADMLMVEFSPDVSEVKSLTHIKLEGS